MQCLQLMLGKKCLGYIMAGLHHACKILISTGSNTQQGRFTFTVGAYQSNFIAFFYYRFRVVQNFYGWIAFA